MDEWIEKEISIGEIHQLIKEGYDVEVDSPDGWVGVNFFVDKGLWEEYVLTTENGFVVRCNENHLFKTSYGWENAQSIFVKNDIEWSVNTCLGLSKATIIKTGNRIPIVDININHENHRYYTNGIESHNTGVGKSMFMCHCAAANLRNGYNVLYITMEMSEEKVAKRIDANLFDTNIGDLKFLPKDVTEKKIDRLKAKVKGKLIIKEYPTTTGSAANFRHLLNELRIKKNFVPDIVYIDYLNICASSRLKQGANVNSYTYIKAIAEEIRGLAMEFNIPIVSATQTTRSGFRSSDVELTDTSESFGLPMTADLMFALISTEELQELNQIMVKQLKNRDNDISAQRRFVVGVDRAKMKLYNVEQSAQEDIMETPEAPTNNFRFSRQ